MRTGWGTMRRDAYKIIVFSFLLICSVISVYADDIPVAEKSIQDSVAAPAENELILQTESAAVSLQGDSASRGNRSGSTGSMLFQLIISLAVVCALIYGVLYVIRRSKRFTAADDPFLRTVATLTLAPNKTLYIVTLIDKAYLIGASDASLSLIAEVTDKELIDAMNLHAAQTPGPKQDFASFLHTFFPAAKPKDADANPFDSFLTKQRERLQSSGVASDAEAAKGRPRSSTVQNGSAAADTRTGEGSLQFNTGADTGTDEASMRLSTGAESGLVMGTLRGNAGMNRSGGYGDAGERNR